MGQRRFIFNTSNDLGVSNRRMANAYLCFDRAGDCIRNKKGPRPGHRHPPQKRKEESPDSIERRTGEEPGLVSAGTESATENDRPDSMG